MQYYEYLLKMLPEDEPVEFGDSVHSTIATKISYEWIRKGTDKLIETTASRTRMNLLSSLSLETMNVTIWSYEMLDSSTMEEHFKKLHENYPKAAKIHLILDRGSYNTSPQTQKAAEKYSIVLPYLPPHNPPLNPIERFWKGMNERVRNKRYFHSLQQFKLAVMVFFDKTWDKIVPSMVDRINDNFQILKQASSSRLGLYNEKNKGLVSSHRSYYLSV